MQKSQREERGWAWELRTIGNGASLPITHTGTLSHVPNIHLLDVLVVPHLKGQASLSQMMMFSLSMTILNRCIWTRELMMDARST